MSQSSISEQIDEWFHYKRKVKEFEMKLEEVKKDVITYMERNNIDVLRTEHLIVKKSELEREVITKKDIPSELWEKYSRKSKSKMYKISKRKD